MKNRLLYYEIEKYFSHKNALIITGMRQVGKTVLMRQLFENAVVNQLARYGQVSFYNKKNTAEIDAILDKKIAFEIKLNATPSDLYRLQKLSQKIGIRKSFMISRSCKEQKNTIFPVFI